MKKNDSNSPAASAATSAVSSPHPGGASKPTADHIPSPLGGPLAGVESEQEGPSLSLGAAAIEGQPKADKPRLVFPSAANAAKPSPTLAAGDDRKPKLTFGGGLASPAAGLSSPGPEGDAVAKPRLTFGGGLRATTPGGTASGGNGSGQGLKWPTAASSSASSMEQQRADQQRAGARAGCLLGNHRDTAAAVSSAAASAACDRHFVSIWRTSSTTTSPRCAEAVG